MPRKNYHQLSARQIVRYFAIYRQHLLNHNLDDDSKSISVEDLVNYVEEQISEETRMVLADEISIL